MIDQREQELKEARAERKQARTDNLDFRTKQLQATGDARADTLDFRKQQLQATGEVNAEKQKENLRRVWSDTADMIGRWVKDGVTSAEMGEQQLRAALDKVPEEQKQLLADHPIVQALQSGQPIWQTPKKTPPVMTPTKIGNRPALIGPGGSVHMGDEWSPTDKVDLDDVTKSLRDIDRETRANATGADPDKARALNAQRKILETRKEALMGKYRQKQQPPEEKPAAGAQGEAVLMKNKDGQVVKVPADKVEWAKQNGYAPAP